MHIIVRMNDEKYELLNQFSKVVQNKNVAIYCS